MSDGIGVEERRATKFFVLDPLGPLAPGEYPWRNRVEGSQTGGRLAMGEAHMPARSGGPPLHVHTREDEAGYVIDGVVTVFQGEERFEVEAGGFFWLPRGVPHTFANFGATPARAVGLIVPGGLEVGLAEEVAYLRSLQSPPDPAKLAAILEPYGVSVVGPPVFPDRQ